MDKNFDPKHLAGNNVPYLGVLFKRRAGFTILQKQFGVCPVGESRRVHRVLLPPEAKGLLISPSGFLRLQQALHKELIRSLDDFYCISGPS